MINAENAALKAPKFAKPNDRARHALFDSILEEFTATPKSEKTEKSSERLSDKPIASSNRPTSGGNDAKDSKLKEKEEEGGSPSLSRMFSTGGNIGGKKKYYGGSGSMNDLSKDMNAASAAAGTVRNTATMPRTNARGARFSLIPSLMSRGGSNAKDIDTSKHQGHMSMAPLKSPLRSERPTVPATAADSPLVEEE